MRELTLDFRSFDGSRWTVEAVTAEGDEVCLQRSTDGGALPAPCPVSVRVPGVVLRLALAMLEAAGDS